MAKKKYTEQEVATALSVLRKFRGQNIIATITSVSQSGMSRNMKFAYWSTATNSLWNVTWAIATVLDMSLLKSTGCLRVSGVGMDMIFHVLSELNYAMARHDTGKTISELLETKECGERIYDTYFVNANNYQYL